MSETSVAANPSAAADPAKSAWLERVLGISIGGDRSPKADMAGLRKRLAVCTDRLAELADPKLEAGVSRVIASINTAIEAGDAGAALPLFGRLEEILDAAERRKTATSPIERNLVKYRTMHAEWLIAERQATADLQDFGKQVLAHPEIAASSDRDAVAQYVDELPKLVPAFGAELRTLLDGIEQAPTDPARETAVTQSRAKIKSYQDDLLGDSRLVGLEAFAAKHFSGLAVLTNLRSALSKLDAAVAG